MTLLIETESNNKVNGCYENVTSKTPLLASVEHERTPGAVAVMPTNGEGAGIDTRPTSPNFAGVVETNSLPSPDGRVYPRYRDSVSKCGTSAVFTDCESHEHHYAKVLLCGKEWCPVCGERGSKAHNRRIAAWLPKFQQLETEGYFVIELPDRYRKLAAWGYSQEGIRRMNNLIVDTLAGKRGKGNKRHGYFSRGVLKWHWFGDKVEGKYNPHANVVVDGGFIESEKLEEIKASLRNAFEMPDLIISYTYKGTPAEMYASLEYITRPTFRKEFWDLHMANEIWNFRSSRWWGKWNDGPAWEVTQDMTVNSVALKVVSHLGAGQCPKCGKHLEKWSKPVPVGLVESWGGKEIGDTGYYEIPHKNYEGGEMSPAAVLRLQRLEEVGKKKQWQLRMARYELYRQTSNLVNSRRLKLITESVYVTRWVNLKADYMAIFTSIMVESDSGSSHLDK